MKELLQQALEDAVLARILLWHDSKETDTPQEVSVMMHHIRELLADPKPVQPKESK